MSALLSRVRELQPFMACRETNQKVVIGKTSGHQPATLQVHGSIASIMASMETVTSLEPFIAAVQIDFEEKLAAGRSTRRPNAKSSSTAMVEELRKFVSGCLFQALLFSVRLCRLRLLRPTAEGLVPRPTSGNAKSPHEAGFVYLVSVSGFAPFGA
ncbi:hypothetical protein [Rhizobium leguminosarum]|uniref:hypothetical protein n=1 Tax=Rhizobium leguminosarum TaxID=384 RepID=UPI001012F2F4|nr:hypothetical protein [Rhizobium leguminosarum]